MAKIRTFVLVYEDKVISPQLVTVREYANWMEQTFDETICHMHLYLNSKKANAQIVSEWHPGTKLGSFFDNQEFHKPELHSWYINSKSKAIQQLIKHKLAELKDCQGDKLRVYTVNQIELYIQSNVDNQFSIADKLIHPKQIVLSKNDMAALKRPTMKQKRKLF